MPETFDLRLLEPFVALAEELHFGRAAMRLHLSSPALSLQIQRLEKQLGVDLFARSTRMVELLPAGRALLPHARRALVAAHFGTQEARATSSGDAGTVRIAVADHLTPNIGAALRRFRRTRPRLTVEWSELPDADAVQQVQEGTSDVALVWSTPDRLEGEELRVEIVEIESRVAMPAGHRLAVQPSVTRDQLAGETIVMFSRSLAPPTYDRLVDGIGDRATITHIDVGPLAQEDMLSAARERGVLTVTTPEDFRNFAAASMILRALEPPLTLELALIHLGSNPNVTRLVDFLRSAAPPRGARWKVS